MRKFLKSWAINTLAVLVAVYIVPGIHFTDDSLLTPLITSLVLGILNAFIRPILMLLALPLLIYTLGLFTLVINALLLYFVSFLLAQHFAVDNFGAALLGALIISIVSLVLNLVTGGSRAKVRVRRGRRPSDSNAGGSGPVIDV
ncbi:MAG TPA: phage holin family protein [Verrucomicrobiota bacterium]|jgi:putative membrane protein|nr:phage holin family protein [Verrucomicrobiota bacterium]HQL79658.1 phage holin family protein [Verrucomicrobiota bacterium]